MIKWMIAGVLAGCAAAGAQVSTLAPTAVAPGPQSAAAAGDGAHAATSPTTNPMANSTGNPMANPTMAPMAGPGGKPGGPAGAAGGVMPASAPTLPAAFSILQTRNMFVKGGGNGAAAAGGPEAQFVLKGAVEGGGVFMAFLEEKGSKRVTQVKVGDSIARGKVKSITLDAIEYEAGGADKRIQVGQDLNGQVAPPTPRPATKPAGGAPPGPVGPGQMPPGAMPPGAVRGGAPPGQAVPRPAGK